MEVVYPYYATEVLLTVVDEGMEGWCMGEYFKESSPGGGPCVPAGPSERGEGCAEWLELVQHDFIKSSKSDKTWAAYRA